MTHKKSIFIFRRDLRVTDNIGLIEALKSSENVIPIFILTPDQLKNNAYKSSNCVQFMAESLDDLENTLKQYKTSLLYFYGDPEDVISKLLEHVDDISAVYVNMDYSPYAIQRDAKIKKECDKIKSSSNDDAPAVEFISHEDLLLNPVGSITNSSGNVYSKFTPYFMIARTKPVAKPITNVKTNNFMSPTEVNKIRKIKGLSNLLFKGALTEFYTHNPNLYKSGGRTHGLKGLADVKDQKDYNKKRDDLNYQTSNLSAYLRFGCISIRETYHVFKSKLGPSNQLIKQLYWRDFYYNITWGFPHVIGGAMKPQYNKLKWDYNITYFNKWKAGETGYPIVDAAMRSMNTTGFMHNRARLIVSSFLIKILLLDWKKGEKYFAQTLYDYDIHNNNGGWQWSASTGADSQPYFRIFNPWLQSAKYDPEAEYIKKWVPELAEVPAKHLHQWDKFHEEHPDVKYPSPIVDYAKNKAESIERYKKI